MAATWCCGSFKTYVGSSEERGISIALCRSPDGEIHAQLQFFARDKANDEKPFPSLSFPIALASKCFIKFCPWCGEHIGTRYKNADASLCVVYALTEETDFVPR
jgi:hypothetical protein